MIDDQIYLQGTGDLGIEMTDDEIRTFALNRFAPPGAPLIAPSPTATLTAERAAMATSTAASLFATPIGSPVAERRFQARRLRERRSAARRSPARRVWPHRSQRHPPPRHWTSFPRRRRPHRTRGGPRHRRGGICPVCRRRFSPGAPLSGGLPAVGGRTRAGPSEGRRCARGDCRAERAAGPRRHPPAYARAAEAARVRVTDGGEDFATVARELSTDESTAANGGDLGWFTHEEMVAPFAEAAFALEPGAISEPVETEFGWHVIQVTERDSDRPLTDLQINRLQQAAEERWLAEQRAELTVTSTLPPTPAPLLPATSRLLSEHHRYHPRHRSRLRRLRRRHQLGSLSLAHRPGSTRAGGGIDRAILKSGPRRRRS